MHNSYNLFDFDGTIISHLKINYDEMKMQIKEILCFEGELKPMFDVIIDLCKNDEYLKTRCFNIIDQYEMNALLECKINYDIFNIYNESKPKIIISRNGEKVIKAFFDMNHFEQPDFISCRDNCYKLKPNIEQMSTIFEKYPFMNKDNIVMIGDSWHDEELSKNINCKFIDITNQIT